MWSKLMKPKVYLETSFVSYLTAKLSHDLMKLQRQLSSQRWWHQQRQNFDLFVSQTVFEEIWQGDAEAAGGRSLVLEGIPLLPLTGRILEGYWPGRSGATGAAIRIECVFLSYGHRRCAWSDVRDDVSLDSLEFDLSCQIGAGDV
jgi:hypothetical protein